MPSYVSNFKKFMKSEEKKTSETGANPQLVEEDTSLLTDPDLVRIQEQIRNLEKQLEAAKQQEETKLRDLRAKAAAEAQKQATAAPAAPAQPAA